MSKRDFYEVLGVERGADAATLKSAYRKLAMQYHPDRNPDNAEAEAKFKEINAAYEILKDDQKRAAYDQFGHAAFEGGGPGAGGGGGAGFGGFADIFEEMFGDFMGGRGGQRGGGRGGRAQARGADLRFDLEITLEEAFTGLTKTIEVPSSKTCEDCDGSGGRDGAKPETCQQCGGAGQIRSQQGFFTVQRTCPVCHGQGRVITDPCNTCHGQGRVRTQKTLEVNIPPGVEEGTRIRLAGEGEAGMNGAPAGDLYIFLAIAPHPMFQRDGANLFVRVPVPMVTATLGGKVELPCIDGSRVSVNIPEGCQSGHQFRLKGKGMSILRSKSRGDMFIEAAVEIPVKLNARQKELLEEFAREGGAEQSPRHEGFFDRVKQFWDDLTES